MCKITICDHIKVESNVEDFTKVQLLLQQEGTLGM